MPPKASLPIKGYGKLEGKIRKTSSEPRRNSTHGNPPKATPEITEAKSKGKRPATTSYPSSSSKRITTRATSPLSAPHLSYLSLPSSWTAASPSSPSSNPKTLSLTYHTGSLFECPPSTLLIHACNTLGHWGAGIASAFKQQYPRAYIAHNAFCAKEHDPRSEGAVPSGTAQILMPVDARTADDGDADQGQKGVFVGCVFTSARYGRAKDKPDAIVKHTVSAMEMLLELVRVHDERVDAAIAGKRESEGEAEVADGIAAIGKIGKIRMCKINSGKFGVPWEKTAKALESIVVREGWRGTVEVWDLEAS